MDQGCKTAVCGGSILGCRGSAKGKGVPQDNVRAYAWFSIAATQEVYGGKKGKDIDAKLMTPTQIAKAQKLSSELWEKYVVPFQKE